MTTQVIRILTEQQRLALAHKLTSFIDAKEDTFLADVHVHPMQVEPLLQELHQRGFIHRDHAHGRVSPGEAIPKAPEVQDFEARRDAMLRASEVGRKVLALGGATPGPKPGLSAARRKQLLEASSGGRGLLREEAAKKQGS